MILLPMKENVVIRHETVYKQAVQFIQEQEELIRVQKETLKKQGLSEEAVETTVSHQEEHVGHYKNLVTEYDNAKNGVFPTIHKLDDIKRVLILYRIYRNISTSELGEKLGVPSTAISRYETKVYNGASLTRIQEVMDALDMKCTFKITV